VHYTGIAFWKSSRRQLYDLQEPGAPAGADYSDKDAHCYGEPFRQKRLKTDQLQGLIDEISSVKGKQRQIHDSHELETVAT